MSNSEDKRKESPIADQQDALGMYFDSLLSEDLSDDEVILTESLLSNDGETETKPSLPEMPVVCEEALLIPPRALNTSTIFAEPDSIESTILVVPENDAPEKFDGSAADLPPNRIDEISDEPIQCAIEPGLTAGTNEEATVPEWGQSYFQCLMFKVAGITLAAPLERLNGILEWPENITVLPGQASWFVGLVRNRDQNVQIIDLAGIINANVQQPDVIPPLSKRARYIMLIDDGYWGLASESVSDVLTLESKEVRWNDNKNQKWLVGTVVKEMCTLLDVDVLIDSLQLGL